MKAPRDKSWQEVVRALGRFGYQIVRQSGSHIRLTTSQNGEHHVTVPAHNPIRVGTLNAIVRDVARHFGKSLSEMMESLFG
ncbi:MAG: YcfA family protein [Phycisphaerales bacterium]|nr:YcfA family protein [Phycisphaerales bacterium]